MNTAWSLKAKLIPREIIAQLYRSFSRKYNPQIAKAVKMASHCAHAAELMNTIGHNITAV
jgi:hypothetical protein